MKSLQSIAAELAGYDPQSLRADTVSAFLSRLVTPVTAIEHLPLMGALGRVLAQDVISPVNVPPHDNAAMDGYGFAGAALQPGASLNLRAVGTALAGRAWAGRVLDGQCVRIMTGAILPAGVDTVVAQELVRVQDDAVHIPADVVHPGDNARACGEDLRQGRAALQQGELLTPAALGLVASLGLPTVAVWRRLRVAYFSTGDEILSLGEPAREGAVYDSNRYTVFGLLTRMGAEVIDLGVVGDDPSALRAAFVRAARQADVVITSGGVSVGEADHTKAMMRELGDVAFWRIAMRPGRPMAVGRILQEKLASSPDITSTYGYQLNSDCLTSEPSGTLLFGLPGNPVAVMVTFLAFVQPALRAMMGQRPTARTVLRARSAEAIRKKPGRTEYQRGVLSRDAASGDWMVRTTGNQGSGVLRSMVEASGLIVLGHDQGNVAVGDWVDVWPFDGLI